MRFKNKMIALCLGILMVTSVSVGINARKDMNVTRAASGDVYTFSSTSGSYDTNVDFSTAKNSSSNTPAFIKNLRLYYHSSGDGCSITFTPKEGITITGFTLNATDTEYAPTVKFKVDSGADMTANLSNTTYSASGFEASSTLEIRNANTSNKQLRITSCSLTYVTSGDVDTNGVVIDSECKNKTLTVGSTLSFSATTEPEDVEIMWDSSNPAVASFGSGENENVLTANSVGLTTVTVLMYVDEKSYEDTTTINVMPAARTMTIGEILDDTSADDYSSLYVTTGIIKGWGSNGTDASASSSGRYILKDEFSDDEILVYFSTFTESALSWNASKSLFDYSKKDNFTSTAWTNELTIGSRVTMEAVRIVYGGTTIELYGVLTDKVVEGIASITATPNKTSYYQGDSISKDDFDLVATYNVKGDVIVSDKSSVTITPEKLNTIGENDVTISYEGKTSTYKVNVEEKIVNVTSIAFDCGGSYKTTTKHSLTITPTVEPINHTEELTWSSSNEEIATVDNGVVTFLKDGLVEIALTSSRTHTTASVVINAIKGASYSKFGQETLTHADTAATSTSYVSWTSVGEAISYSGNSSKSSSNAIQLRSSSNSGIVMTSSSSSIKKVTVSWQGSTTSGRTLNVYGSNTAYTAPSELYNNETQGTLLGTIVCGTSTELTIEDDYKFVGVRSASSTMYLTSITFDYEQSYVGSVEDIEAINGFVDTLHLDSYNDNLGYCNDSEHHYYITAKGVMSTLSNDQLALFKEDSSYAEAKARYEAWAGMNGDTKPYEGSEIVLESMKIFNEGSSSGEILTVAILLSITSFSIVGAYLFLKKKKEQ